MTEMNEEIKESSKELRDVREVVFNELDAYFSKQDALPLSTSTIIRQIRFRHLGEQGFSKDHVQLCAESYMEMQMQRRKKALIEHIRYSGLPLSEVHRIFSDYLRPALADPNSAELVAWVMMHFIWQVKRKMEGIPVHWHLCPVFISRQQGTGKSEFVRNLCKPFGLGTQFSLSVQKTLGELSDEREQVANFSKFIVFLDELSGASKAEWSKLKSLITADLLQPRLLGSNSQDWVKNSATFIATANADSLADKIKDDTGNRRFFPIAVSSFVRVPSFCCENPIIRSMIGDGEYLYPLQFDSRALWSLVDEHWDFFLPVEEVKLIQSHHRAQDEVESFIDALQICTTAEAGYLEWIESGLLHTAFKRFASTSSYARYQKQFTRRFGELIGQRPEPKAGLKKNRNGFRISLSREVLNEYLKNPLNS